MTTESKARCIGTASDALGRAVESYDRGNLVAAERFCREALALNPALGDANLLLGDIHLGRRSWAAAIEAFEGAIATTAHRTPVEERLKTALFSYANELMSAQRQREAIPVFRRLLDFFPNNPIIRNNLADILTATREPARLADFVTDLSPPELGTHLFIACMPKSGSTFLPNCLVRLSGFERSFLSFAYMQNEQEIYLPHLAMQARKNTVTQQHCRATAANVQLMQAFGIRPIVLVRKLEDTVVSLLDFYDQGAVITSFLKDDYDRLDRAARIDALIDLTLPWYVQFYVSWVQAERHGSLEILWISYEDLVRDKPGTLDRVARFYRLPWTQKMIEQALGEIEKVRTGNRFNAGVVGRGGTVLTALQKERIARLAKSFPSVDFSRIGL